MSDPSVGIESTVKASEIVSRNWVRFWKCVVIGPIVVVGSSWAADHFEMPFLGSVASLAFIFTLLLGISSIQMVLSTRQVVRELAANPDARAWLVQLLLVNGKRLNTGLSSYMVVHGNEYTVYFNGRIYERGFSTIVEAGPVTRSDVQVTQGKRAGSVIPQISMVQDSLLIACAGRSNGPRPTAFFSTPGSNQDLSVWTRVS